MSIDTVSNLTVIYKSLFYRFERENLTNKALLKTLKINKIFFWVNSPTLHQIPYKVR